MHYLYLIQCSDGSFYTGITGDLERRFREHRLKKGSLYTKVNKPINLLYSEKYKTKSEATRIERQIKGWRREKKFNLIKFGKPNISK